MQQVRSRRQDGNCSDLGIKEFCHQVMHVGLLASSWPIYATLIVLKPEWVFPPTSAVGRTEVYFPLLTLMQLTYLFTAYIDYFPPE